MDPSRSRDFRRWKSLFLRTRITLLLFILLAGMIFMHCGKSKFSYTGDVRLDKHTWLKDKRIFLDPGHGGKGERDLFRIGPGNLREEEVNLRVCLLLANMLERAGSRVKLSRTSDSDVSLEERVRKAEEFMPDLLISVHHNGTVRRMDGVNYPLVLLWGSRETSPAAFDLAVLLLGEFRRIMDPKGQILSDFSVFPETGTMILRETRTLCPGVIGEAGFFSDPIHAKMLADLQYSQLEAEAYFMALSEYLRRGIPKAEVYLSCPLENKSTMKNLIRENNPLLVIKAASGTPEAGIDSGSFRALLDNIPVRCVFLKDNIFLVDYGRRLYPGNHRMRFSFRNQRSQSSMILRADFSLEPATGDYQRLVNEGMRSVRTGYQISEGLKKLASALSMGSTDPGADLLIEALARGFALTGQKATAEYYLSRLRHFYPDSALSRRRGGGEYTFPVEFPGKEVEIKSDPSLKEKKAGP